MFIDFTMDLIVKRTSLDREMNDNLEASFIHLFSIFF